MTSTILGIIVLVTVLGGSFYLSRRNNPRTARARGIHLAAIASRPGW